VPWDEKELEVSSMSEFNLFDLSLAGTGLN